MVQLEVGGVFLDLYDLDPPKLTFNIEDVRDTSYRSLFSREFRIPATAHNNGFFTNAFNINGVDFDASIKREARVYVNGLMFRSGQLRLLKIYDTRDGEKYEYECLFLGETKDFGTAVGDGYLNSLNLSAYTHELTINNVLLSWQAYPSGTTTNGLLNGDILYPLIDFGVNYDGDGIPIETRISQNNTGEHFTQNSHPLPITRFKPMIRAKAVLDAIFDEAGYSYTSDFLTSNLFKQLYLSAFGNTASITTPTSSNLMSVRCNFIYFIDEDTLTIPYTIINYDNNDRYNETTYTYTAAVTGTYKMRIKVGVNLTPNITQTGDLQFKLLKNGSTTISATTYDLNITTPNIFTWDLGEITTTLNANDTLNVQALVFSGDVSYSISYSTWVITDAPGTAAANVTISNLLDDKYKKLDFVKDILTRFRLVMVPNPHIEKDFLIEPWNDYIGSGQLLDWTHKMDLTKDVIYEPLFNNQSQRIIFNDKQDEDFLNKLNFDVFKEVFGTLIVNSQNDYLEGDRNITTSISPTPITQIERKNTAIGTTFIIPHIHAHEPGTDASYLVQHKPIRSGSRLLFYNGTKSTDGVNWYIQSYASNPLNYYPMVSFYNSFPNSGNTLNLNWQSEVGYVDHNINDGLIGDSVYNRYWSGYIDNIYNPFSRRLTAYFILDDTDLLEFGFDDVIFIKNNYFYVERIYDVPIGFKASVKVDLIKLLNYQVDTSGFIPFIRTWDNEESVWNTANFTWN